MNISEAAVDLKGNLVLDGTMSYPPSRDPEVFPQVDHKQLILRWTGDFLSPANVSVDPESGFYQASRPTVRMNASRLVRDAILDAIRSTRHSSRPGEIAISGSTGALVTGLGPGYVAQALGAGVLTFAYDDAEGSVAVKLQAALVPTLGTDIFPSEPGYWPSIDGEPQRVTVQFTVNAATRVACFGVSGPSGLPDRADDDRFIDPPAEPRTTANLCLAEARLGSVITSALDQDGLWVEIRSGGLPDPDFAITRTGALQLRNTGFIGLHSKPYRRLPDHSIIFHGWDLKAIALFMSRRTHFSMTLKDGQIGWLHIPRGFDGMGSDPDYRFLEAQLDFVLDHGGLHFSYRVLVNDYDASVRPYRPGWIVGEVHIWWETILLRFPSFLNQRVLTSEGPVDSASIW